IIRGFTGIIIAGFRARVFRIYILAVVIAVVITVVAAVVIAVVAAVVAAGNRFKDGDQIVVGGLERLILTRQSIFGFVADRSIISIPQPILPLLFPPYELVPLVRGSFDRNFGRKQFKRIRLVIAAAGDGSAFRRAGGNL